jgi:hypothetical protein
VAVPFTSAGFVESRSIRIAAGAGNGEAVTYTSWTSFGAAEGAPATNQYLSRRTAAGWATENVSPLGTVVNVLLPPYAGFSPDLRFGAFKTREPALTEGCREGNAEGAENIYLRDNQTGALRCLDLNVSGGPEGIPCLNYGGASEDGARAFIAGPPEGGEALTYSLYESGPEGMREISILPGGEAAPATQGTAFGPGGQPGGSGPGAGIENCQVTRTILRHAVSRDGSRVFWTFVPEESEAAPSQLLVRVDNAKTEQLDKKRSGGSGEGEGKFWGADAEGTVAYFTDTQRLITGAKAEAGKPDLYRYEVGRAAPLTDLTAGGTGAGGVKGVVGISDDGSYVYFVASGALAAGAEEGKDNLYLFHEGTTRFIAALNDQDAPDWSDEPRETSARVSPDGTHLAFLSIEAKALAGYENRIAGGEHCKYQVPDSTRSELIFTGSPLCSQAFLYDAGTEELSCASCNPSGSRPLGPTIFPGWSNGFEGPRFLSNDGKRLFFASLDAILPSDVNGKLDVYELERPEEGTCSEANPNFDPAADGCHFPITSGRSEDESYLVDASEDGRDVFLSTRQALTGWDVNENYDVYDYREGGGFAEPALPPASCEAEASCVPSATPTPAPPTPATPTFNGPGNPKPTKPKPHHHKKKHRKHHRKKKKQKGKAKKHRGQAKKGRAGR